MEDSHHDGLKMGGLPAHAYVEVPLSGIGFCWQAVTLSSLLWSFLCQLDGFACSTSA